MFNFDLYLIPASFQVCDLKCDCPLLCDDEMLCNNISYGLKCEVRNKRGKLVTKEYIGANSFCDGVPECYRDPEDDLPALDERYCDEKTAVARCMNGNLHRNLYANQICAVPTTAQNIKPICTDGKEQINCVDEDRVGLFCRIEQEESTVSKLAMCAGHGLCDDGYDDACYEAEGSCYIHKALLCNGREDCSGGGDEKMTMCRKLYYSTCIRRHPYKDTEKLRIPANWVKDGAVDCVDSRDELPAFWDKCGREEGLTRYVEPGTVCEDVYLCDQAGEIAHVKFIQFFEMCDRINTCGRENNVCIESRNQFTTWNSLLQYEPSYKILLYCIQGLEYLQIDAGSCQKRMPFGESLERAIGASTTYLDLPITPVDCTHTYGETLVYLSCSNLCINTECVLKPIPKETCVNKANRAYAMTQDSQLSLIIKMAGNRYGNEFFPCDNKQCVPYSDVCNLVNDCGDMTDERDCNNHFFCPAHGEYIPLSSKCDNFEDCRNFEDECNSDCTKNKRIIESRVLRVSAWSVGVSAVAFNGVLMVTSIKNFWQTEMCNAAMNHALISTIGLSDMVVGIYLLVLATTDLYYENTYCRNKYLWLSSKSCAALGVVNNIAYQLSLFSMTTLSLLRVFTVGNMIQKKLDDGRYERLKIFSTVVVVFVLAIPCAVIPLVPSFEDFFVNGLYYHDNPIFTASVDKATHFKILKAHYGRLYFRELSWKNIRMLVAEMFSNDYGGK